MICIVARMGLYLPYIWKYHRDERLMFPMFPYLWLFTNIVLLVVKTCDNIADNLSNSNAWFMLLASGVSVLLQVRVSFVCVLISIRNKFYFNLFHVTELGSESP